jgi:hypothetical protein
LLLSYYVFSNQELAYSLNAGLETIDGLSPAEFEIIRKKLLPQVDVRKALWFESKESAADGSSR